jgi:hypothetical protein
MFLTKLKLVAMLGLAVGVLATSAGVRAQQNAPREPVTDSQMKMLEEKLDRVLEVLGATRTMTRPASGEGATKKAGGQSPFDTNELAPRPVEVRHGRPVAQVRPDGGPVVEAHAVHELQRRVELIELQLREMSARLHRLEESARLTPEFRPDGAGVGAPQPK